MASKPQFYTSPAIRESQDDAKGSEANRFQDLRVWSPASVDQISICLAVKPFQIESSFKSLSLRLAVTCFLQKRAVDQLQNKHCL